MRFERKLYGLDLFSGIGGISIALEDWVEPVAYCERERFSQGVLLSRMSEGLLHRAPIWNDVTTLTGAMLPQVDIIFGGFPCQDISVAGAGKGLEGERSGLFREIVRLALETKAPFIFLENVPTIRTRGLRQVVGTLAQVGYDCRWTCISASDVGANHKRERWFLLAYSHGVRKLSEQESGQHPSDRLSNYGENVANGDRIRLEGSEYERQGFGIEQQFSHGGGEVDSTNSYSSGLEGQRQSCGISAQYSHASDESWWATEPNVGRVAHGVSQRVDRIKSLGNSVVPLQVKTAFEILIGLRAGAL